MFLNVKAFKKIKGFFLYTILEELKQKIESQTKEMLNLQKELKSVKEKMSIKKTADR